MPIASQILLQVAVQDIGQLTYIAVLDVEAQVGVGVVAQQAGPVAVEG
jgi:hypothetical protein